MLGYPDDTSRLSARKHGEQATMRYMGFPYAEGAGEIGIDKIAGLKSRDRNQRTIARKLDFCNYGPYDAELYRLPLCLVGNLR